MKSSKTKIAVLVALIVAAVGLATVATPQTTSAVAPTPRAMRVKLFEDGKQIGEWTTEGGARNEGNVLIFSTRQGVSSREVRIHGTYVAEAID